MMRAVARTNPAVGGLLDAVVGISEGLDLERVLRRLVQAAAAHTGARYAALGVLGPDGLHETFVHHGMADDLVRAIGPLPRGHGVLGLITREQRVVRVEDISRHPAAVGFPPGHPPMGTFLGVPLRVRDEVFGNLYLTDKPGGFTDADVDTVQVLGAAAAVAIDNARLFRTVARREAWATAAQRVTTVLLEGSDEEEALGLIAAQARLVAGAAVAALVLPSLDSSLVVEVLDTDEPLDLLGSPLPDDVRPDEELPDGSWLVRDLSAATAHPGLGTLGPAIAARLADDDGQLGVLLLARPKGASPFVADDLATVTSFASQAALALRLAAARRQADVLALYEERQRIARDLHDLAVQQLFAAGMQLSRLRGEPAPAGVDGPERSWRRTLDAALDGIDEAVQQIRATIRSLHGHDHDLTLVGRIERETTRAAGLLGFPPALALNPPGGPERPLDPDLVDDLAAVVREALSNVARHARAGRVDVRLDVTPHEVTLGVADDGVGIGTAGTTTSRRSGLANFDARARHHGGAATVSRRPEGGTLVQWRVPLVATDRTGSRAVS
ncbi:MAG: GAF domain-containing protein [Kineosporiaceae bacterium]